MSLQLRRIGTYTCTSSQNLPEPPPRHLTDPSFHSQAYSLDAVAAGSFRSVSVCVTEHDASSTKRLGVLDGTKVIHVARE
jgi:hypothetical protein